MYRLEPDASAIQKPSADEVRKELARLVSDRQFDANGRRIGFLEYVVTETLAGRVRNLKGSTIAMEVLGRGEMFDQQTDPVARIAARRLRRDLDSYHGGAGATHAVRISILKGDYAAEFAAGRGSGFPNHLIDGDKNDRSECGGSRGRD